MAGPRGTRAFAAGLVAALTTLAGCGREVSNPAPPRLETPAAVPQRASTVALPVTARVADLEARLNAEVPRVLWRIDQQERACVPAQRLKIGKRRLKVTPDISCRIVGRVTRGPIRLTGGGADALRLTMPVSAAISAEDIGHVIDKETATAAAEVRARVRLGVDRNWRPVAKVAIDYDWTEEPGIELLDRRITFGSRADPKLAQVVARLEASLPKELAKLHSRERLEAAWRQGFTSIELNRANPPVWLRVTPERLGYGDYRIEDGLVVLPLSLQARTETFVGPRPPDPTPTPLPPPAAVAEALGFAFHVPVIAAYAELEPVVARALAKLSRKGIVVPRIGPVDAEFGKVTIYATGDQRLAVGVDVAAKAQGGLLSAKGKVWLTGAPHNEAGSQRVEVRDLKVAGKTDSRALDLLFRLTQSPEVNAAIRGALVQNFAKDYAKIVGIAERAIAARRLGDFEITTRVDEVRNGVVVPIGQGLYMPVEARGAASIRYAPRGPAG